MPRGYNTITQRVRYQSVVIFPTLELIRVTHASKPSSGLLRFGAPELARRQRREGMPGAPGVVFTPGARHAKPQSLLAQSPGHSAWRLSVLNSISAVPC